MQTAMDVAGHILTMGVPCGAEPISNLKLQKLLYYAQGVHLARYGPVLFGDNIVAWEHGPVVEVVYHAYKSCGDDAIPPPAPGDARPLAANEQRVLREVLDCFGQFSAWDLRNMTHEEAPWLETTRGGAIGPGLIRDHFVAYYLDAGDAGFVALPATHLAEFGALHKGRPTLSPDVLERARRAGVSAGACGGARSQSA